MSGKAVRVGRLFSVGREVSRHCSSRWMGAEKQVGGGIQLEWELQGDSGVEEIFRRE
jgi:hypothetical protein